MLSLMDPDPSTATQPNSPASGHRARTSPSAAAMNHGAVRADGRMLPTLVGGCRTYEHLAEFDRQRPNRPSLMGSRTALRPVSMSRPTPALPG